MRPLKCKHCLSVSVLICAALGLTYYLIGDDGMKAFTDQIRALEKESLNISTHLTSTNLNLTDLKTDNDKLKRKLTEMRQLIHSKAHLLTDLKSKNSELDNQVNDARDQVDGLQESVTKLEHDLSERDASLQKSKKDTAEVSRELELARKSHRKVEKELVKLKGDQASVALQGKEMDAELREELAHAHGQYVELKTELESKDDAYKQLEQKSDEQAKHSEELTLEIHNLKHSLNQMKRKFEDRDAKWRETRKAHMDEEKELEVLRAQLAEEEAVEQKVANERDQYLSLVDQEKKLNQQLVSDLEDTKEKANAWESEAESISKKLQNVESSIKHYFAKAQGLKNDISKLNDDRKLANDKARDHKETIIKAVDKAATKKQAIHEERQRKKAEIIVKAAAPAGAPAAAQPHPKAVKK